MDDQLVLGIKATLSIVELKVLKLRMLQGMEEKARRGELKRLLPVGYVRDVADRVVKDPDQRIQEAVGLCFRKFRELHSGRQTFLWFRVHGIEMPVNRNGGGKTRVVWQLPTNSFIQNLLRNPYYAGAFVWGRRETRMVYENGRLQKRQGKIRPAEECRVCLRDHHEAYIPWETFEDNLRILRGNNLKGNPDETAGPVRAGQGLLAGILRCGRCGRKMHVHYRGKSGTAARYLCKGAYGGGGDYCLGFGGRLVDERFGRELASVLSPLGVQASLAAIDRLSAKDQDQRQALLHKQEQCEYETRRAFEQYNEVDPRHRLVATELERRWNAKLEELEHLRSALAELDGATQLLGEHERVRILALGAHFGDVWNSEHCPVELRKRMLRAAVEEIIVDKDQDVLRFVIHWKGGTHTQFEMARPPSGREQKTAPEDVEVIRKMAVRYGDDEIALVLNKLGRRTGKGKRWNARRVADARSTYSISGHLRTVPDPELLTLGGAAKHCGVSQGTIMRLVHAGILNKEQLVPWAPWEIQRSDLDSPEVQRVLTRLRETGKSGLKGVHSEKQLLLF
jgi:hypothetical protein